MGAFSTFHWLLLLVIVLLLFGNRLPSVMRSLGRGVTEFKKGIEGVEDDDEDERRRMKDRKESKDKPQQDA
jgi:sec-independent protein translocase protein TatA